MSVPTEDTPPSNSQEALNSGSKEAKGPNVVVDIERYVDNTRPYNVRRSYITLSTQAKGGNEVEFSWTNRSFGFWMIIVANIITDFLSAFDMVCTTSTTE